jgi:hypothetical protein
MSNEILKDFLGNDQEAFKLSEESIKHLDATRKWSFFLSVLGFVGLGFLVLAGLFMMTIFNSFEPQAYQPFPGTIVGFLYFILAIVYFFPVYYLLKFSSNMKNAIMSRNELTMEEAFRFLKKHYQFIGIMTIVIISLYILILLGFVIAGTAGLLMH